MSSASVEQLKETLLSCLDEERNVTDMAGALDVVTNLQTVSMTKEVLEATRLGLLVNDIRRKNQERNPQLGKLCRGLIKDWQKLVSDASSTQSTGGTKLGVSPGLERLSTPSGRTTTPYQSVAAKKIAESGLRCSPSPALTPKLRQSTPVVVNGSGQSGTLGTDDAGQRGPVHGSSYAPTEQQLPNGPSQAGLKIRIKYGSADQQTSIVREIEQSQAQGEAAINRKGPEEAANRRKRKISNGDQSSRRTLGLVNGGSKSVSPCTPLPSPSPSVVENAGSPGGVHSLDATSSSAANVTSLTKLTKKSKSSSPAPVPSPASSITNILQRPKLKSTAELVAEMTSSYPETMSISLKNVVPTPASPPLGTPGAASSATTTIMESVLLAAGEGSDGSGDDDSKDEDYHEPGAGSKRKAKATWTATLMNDRNRDVNKAELIDRYLRDHPSGRSGRAFGDDRAAATKVHAPPHPPIDWYAAAELPPIDISVLESLVEQEEEELDAGTSKGESKAGPRKEEPEAGANKEEPEVGPSKEEPEAGAWKEESEADPSKEGSEASPSKGGKNICDAKVKEEESSDSADISGKLLDSCIPEDDGLEASSSLKKEGNTTNGQQWQWRSRLLKQAIRGDRQVLAMPYVDIGLPDFLEYGYTNRDQYLAHWSER